MTLSNQISFTFCIKTRSY